VVIGTARAAKHEALHRYGVDEAVDYTTADVARTAGEVDLIVDLVGGSADLVPALRSGGLFVNVPSATPQEVAARAETARASLILCGHTHLPRMMQLDDGRLIVNPGSVGLQAFEDDVPFPHTVAAGSPHARYALVERTNGIWRVEMVAVGYDWNAAATLAERHGCPDWATALRFGRI
jgi:diadenosine tetraphosphatase ApaH/serine/threonine PP2A family protein phosphatase